jgi:uncharacterized protein
MKNTIFIGGNYLKFQYDYTFGLPRNIVWMYIKNEKILADSLTGCRSFVESSPGVYQAEIDINFGPIRDVLSIVIKRVQEKSPTFYRLYVKGKGKLGEIEAEADLNFSQVQEGTKLLILADTQVSGALSGAAKRVLEGGMNQGLERFFQKLERQIKMTLYKMKKRGR